MSRTALGFLAALEAFLTLAIGVGISLVPLTVMWAFQLDQGVGWDVFWRASADIWLAGHGVDFVITLDPNLAQALGLPGAEQPFLISIAALSFALFTLLMGLRIGRNSRESGARFIGPVAAIATFASLTVVVALSSIHASAMPTVWMAVTFPTAIFALGVFIGSRGEVGHSGGQAERVQQRVIVWAEGLSATRREVIRTAVVGGTAAVGIVLAVSAVLFAVALFVNFPTVVSLYEGLQGGAGGGLILTAAQLMFMPNFILWVASWLIGPGFAIGVGSSVSPAGSTLGLLPSLPVLGALPTGASAWGFLGLLVPVAAGFAVAWLVRGKPTARVRAAMVGAVAVVGGLILGLLLWASGGAAGPGRLVQVGPDALLTSLVAACELALGFGLGMLARSRSQSSE
jgi:hypothetical protein